MHFGQPSQILNPWWLINSVAGSAGSTECCNGIIAAKDQTRGLLPHGFFADTQRNHISCTLEPGSIQPLKV